LNQSQGEEKHLAKNENLMLEKRKTIVRLLQKK
jgi:hypothetical protein